MILLTQINSPLGWIYALLGLLLAHRLYLFMLILWASEPAAAVIKLHPLCLLAKRVPVPLGMVGTMIALGSQLNIDQLSSLMVGIGHMINTTIVGLLISIVASTLETFEAHLAQLKESEYANSQPR